ncbi:MULTISPECIES: TerD family protein [Streptomycetaceae]|uniref:TerD family protein n=1 Tax=Streptomycetaceae TaxID=2062 RepID=UPI000CDC1DCE|nr:MULTISPECIES: TerD family protein [Streptomycetaceae]AUY49460.1 Tellurium resistance protein terZ [Streptomyces sp. CB01881]MBP0449976.1 TerD family protein [Kitasatospora sp. RG8]TYC72844.1 TerD family protein [Streptomyces sp. CB01881]
MSVNLAKGQQVSLQKGSGESLTIVRMGLGWKAAPKRGLFGSRTRQIDLDASALLYAEQTPSDVVFFQHLESNDGSVRHTGDNLVGGTGAGGDDESILVDLVHVPAHITQVVFTVSSYTGQTFAEVQNAYCRLVDESTGLELARYELAGGGPHTGQIMAKVFREPSGGWGMQAIGAPARGRTFQDLLPAIEPFL